MNKGKGGRIVELKMRGRDEWDGMGELWVENGDNYT